MKFKQAALVVSLLATLTLPFAAWAGEKVLYQEITDNKPDVGVSTTVYLGDRILEQRRGQWRDCIVPKFSHTGNLLGGWVLTIQSGEPICKLTPNATRYTPNYVNGKSSSSQYTYDVVLNEEKPGIFKICLFNLMNVMCVKDKRPNDFDVGPWFLYNENSFQQTIEYGGRSGDVLKFTYSEFTEGFARQAFTREFQVDLSQGNVAAYKGAIIEIESATNSSITYKVVRNFKQ